MTSRQRSSCRRAAHDGAHRRLAVGAAVVVVAACACAYTGGLGSGDSSGMRAPGQTGGFPFVYAQPIIEQINTAAQHDASAQHTLGSNSGVSVTGRRAHSLLDTDPELREWVEIAVRRERGTRLRERTHAVAETEAATREDYVGETSEGSGPGERERRIVGGKKELKPFSYLASVRGGMCVCMLQASLHVLVCVVPCSIWYSTRRPCAF